MIRVPVNPSLRLDDIIECVKPNTKTMSQWGCDCKKKFQESERVK
jgi:hypothetical protein